MVVLTAFHPFTPTLRHSTTPPTFKPSPSSHFPTSRPPLLSSAHRPPNTPPPPPPPTTHHHDRHKALLVDTFHRNSRLRALIGDLSKEGSSPLRLLERDGDWTQDTLWPVVKLLVENGKPRDALQVFEFWKSKEISRINDFNYSRIIRLLCDGGFMKAAVASFEDMDNYSISPSSAVYNAIIHGFAKKKQFDISEATFRKMLESGLLPTPQTYNGLIRAYGSYGMYDEIGKCVKRMESERCYPDEVTYNILIGVFARGKLLERMEGVYRTLRSKRMNLQSSTLVLMLEAYADLGVLEKMEEVYHKVLKSKAFLKEDLIRNLAMVYIKNYRFSRLEELGHDMASRTGRTDLIWSILLLSCACLLSRKGIDSVTREMKVAKVRFNITFTNVLALFYMKLKYFGALDALLSRAGAEDAKPDMLTFGIFFDACRIGYDGTHVLEIWRKHGFLEEGVEMRTDPLVLAAFKKGFFIRNCETMFYSLDSKAKQRLWTYRDLINLVIGKMENRESACAS